MECMDRQLRSSPPEIPVTRYVPRRTRHGPIPFLLSAWQHAHSHSWTIIPPGFPITPSFSSHPSRGLLLLHLLAWRFGRPPPSNRLMQKKQSLCYDNGTFFSRSEQASALALQKGTGGYPLLAVSDRTRLLSGKCRLPLFYHSYMVSFFDHITVVEPTWPPVFSLVF